MVSHTNRCGSVCVNWTNRAVTGPEGSAVRLQCQRVLITDVGTREDSHGLDDATRPHERVATLGILERVSSPPSRNTRDKTTGRCLFALTDLWIETRIVSPSVRYRLLAAYGAGRRADAVVSVTGVVSGLFASKFWLSKKLSGDN